MRFWVVYKFLDSGGECGHLYFKDRDKASACKQEWEEDEFYSTVCMKENETED